MDPATAPARATEKDKHMITGVYGFNIAVKDLVAATERFEAILGVKGTSLAEEDFAFPGLVGTRLEFGGLVINLITSDDASTSVAKFLDSRGEGLFLVSLTTGDMDGALEGLSSEGITPLLTPPKETKYGRVTFLHPREAHGVQLELLETE